MTPGPALAVSLVEKYLAIDEPPILARDVLIKIVTGEGWVNGTASIQDKADRWKDSFLDRLRTERDSLLEVGRYCHYEFNSSSPYLLQGCAFIEPNDSHAVQNSKRGRARLADYAAAVAGLQPNQFEALCKGLLVQLGAIDIVKTPSQGDDGIDFFGRLHLESPLFDDFPLPGLGRQLKIWIVGQAKHYTAINVSTPDIRELVGSVELARGKSFVNLPVAYRSLEIKACDPVFYLFLTSGSMSADVWHLLAKSGVVGMDGRMIATFLAERHVGVVENAFDRPTFDAWILSNS